MLLDGSGVNQEVHAPFYERPGVQFHRPTHQVLKAPKIPEKSAYDGDSQS